MAAVSLFKVRLPLKKNPCYRLGGLNNGNLFLTVLEVGKSRSRYQLISFLVNAFFLACRQLPSLCVHTSQRERMRTLVSLTRESHPGDHPP